MVVPVGGAGIVLLLVLLAPEPGYIVPVKAASRRQQQHYMDYNTSLAVHPLQGQHQYMEEQESLAAGDQAPMSESFVTEDIQVGCRELRAKRYISDGFCTSIKPIKEVVCAGNCLPIMNLPWYAEFVKVWSRAKLKEWQCEEDVVKRKSVHLLCRNGQYRMYRIKVVKSCKCKRSLADHNRTVRRDGGKKKRRKDGNKEQKGDKRKTSNVDTNNPVGTDPAVAGTNKQGAMLADSVRDKDFWGSNTKPEPRPRKGRRRGNEQGHVASANLTEHGVSDV